MSAAHTPGPWWLTDYGVRDVSGYICAITKPSHFEGQDERFARDVAARNADAILIAAAPDLLAALRTIVEIEEGPGETDRPCMIAARAAIARAESQPAESA